MKEKHLYSADGSEAVVVEDKVDLVDKERVRAVQVGRDEGAVGVEAISLAPVLGVIVFAPIVLTESRTRSGNAALQEIAAALEKIKPDQVHINLPTRPPAEPWVQPPDEEGLMRATAILGDIAGIVHPVEGTFDLSGCENVVDAVVNVLTRHPMREEELLLALERWDADDVQQALHELMASGRAQQIRRYGQIFWSAAETHYA